MLGSSLDHTRIGSGEGHLNRRSRPSSSLSSSPTSPTGARCSRYGRPRLEYRALNDVEHAIRFQTKLIYNVLRFQEKRCSDLRDRIYSLLSISSDGARIEVDNRTSAAEVAYHLCFTGRPVCLCEGTNLDDIFDSLEQRVPWNIAMANMPALTWHAKLTTARNGSFCICGKQVRQHEHDRKLLNIGLEWIDKRVYCLNCLHYQTGIDRMIPHVILARRNPLDSLEVFYISDDKTVKVPAGMRLQSFDSDGDAVFSVPVGVYFRLVTEFPKY
jgi:hypothetical protein